MLGATVECAAKVAHFAGTDMSLPSLCLKVHTDLGWIVMPPGHAVNSTVAQPTRDLNFVANSFQELCAEVLETGRPQAKESYHQFLAPIEGCFLRNWRVRIRG